MAGAPTAVEVGAGSGFRGVARSKHRGARNRPLLHSTILVNTEGMRARIFVFLALVGFAVVAFGNATSALSLPSWLNRSFIVEHVSAFPARVYEALTPKPRHQSAFLLLGKAGPGWTAGELTDTILLASVNTETNRASIISIPRDFLVRLPGQGLSGGRTTKINTLWLIGTQDARRRGIVDVAEQSALLRSAVEEITGTSISEVVVVNVAVFTDAIDALGGIALNVTERIDDPAFPTAGGGTEHLRIEPGFQVLDGATAVKYARTRHTPEGDFGRLRRQHQVLEALAAKARGLKLTEDLSQLLALYELFAGRIETTVSIDEIPGIALTFRGISLSNVKTFALESIGREPLLVSGPGSSLVPREGMFRYDEIRAAVRELIRENEE